MQTSHISYRTALAMSENRFTIPDQPARFAKAKKEGNKRVLDIDSMYDPSYLAGKRVAITGANRGIGLALAKECVGRGAKLVGICRSSSEELEALDPEEVVLGVDVTNDEICEGIAAKITGGPIDILINNAGYFYEPEEKIDCLNFKEVGTRCIVSYFCWALFNSASYCGNSSKSHPRWLDLSTTTSRARIFFCS